MGQHLADYLAAHERTKGMSTGDFGRLVGISKSQAAEILAGRSTPGPQTLKKIAAAFPGVPLAHLEEMVLLDTPFDLPEGAQLLSLKERALIKSVVDQLLESSGKADRVQKLKPGELEELRRLARPGNVVNLHPQADRVSKAAYDPPSEE